MKVSHHWLQDYFDGPLPNAEELAELLTFHAFEIEGVEREEHDVVITIDVLPNRSSDSLSHRGIARELATLLGRELKNDPFRKKPEAEPQSSVLAIKVENETLCPRYSAAVVKNVKVGPSPEWLARRLAALGQKSINNIVDAANYAMLDLGQPLHAFDMAKLKEKDGTYTIGVRNAKEEEKITTLDGEERVLTRDDLIIVDGNTGTPIGIAGVKGGESTGVDENTTDIIIESANFNFVSVRKTSQRHKLQTDASLRFQNGPSPELTMYGLERVVELIKDIAGGELEGYADFYPHPQERKSVSFTVSEVNDLLGSEMSAGEVEAILKRFDFAYEKRGEEFAVTPPFERTDLTIKEDLTEEIGRVHGYEKIDAKPLPKTDLKPEINPVRSSRGALNPAFAKTYEHSSTRQAAGYSASNGVNKRFYYTEKIRDILVSEGFSEVYTYTLTDHGEVEIENPLASDKSFLRENLREGLGRSLELNSRNAPLLGLDKVKIFEIGTVFEKDYEHFSLGIAAVGSSEELREAVKAVEDALGTKLTNLGVQPPSRPPGVLNEEIFEINLDKVIEKLPQPKSYGTRLLDGQVSKEFAKEVKYKPISQYPFALRDIALWVPKDVSEKEMLTIIEKEAGELLVRSNLFDRFEKDDRVSYAFHLVFQSYEKTLSDEELNALMERITRTLNSRENWEVR